MHVIIGLGNPGEKYKKTRHNAGFMAVDFIAENFGASWTVSKKFQAQIADADVHGEKILLVKPLTFMNESGQTAAAILSYYKLLPKTLGLMSKADADLCGALTVIHDDIDIALGSFKIATDSRSAGNRGVQSIIDRLKTQKFRRIRIGIKPADLELSRIPAKDYVLGRFSPEELESIVNLMPDIYKICSTEHPRLQAGR